MPDIGLFELLVIGVLLFVVVGPERMPDFFSQIGRWVQTGRGWIREFRSEIGRETADLREPMDDVRSQMQDGIDKLGVTAREIGDDVHKAADELRDVSADPPGSR